MSILDNKDKNSIEEQLGYAARIKELLAQRYGRVPLAYIHTYGCQQNVSDSERIKGLLSTMGYSMTENIESADLIIFNTCAVREHAEDRVYGNIGMLKPLKEKRHDILIAVCGCMTQQQSVAERLKKSYPYVDIVLGTHVRHRLPEYIYRRLKGEKRVFDISDDCHEIIEGVPVSRDGKFKAWLPIMHGCNNFCTYCIVPYVRGREVSREPDAIIREAKKLIDSGVKEITLLGQNVNSYGKDGKSIDFPELLEKINGIDGDFRIRFMTSHPKDCTDKLLQTMAKCEKVERHLHLPLQSGNDEILRRMNRHYDSKAYLKLVEKARNLIPDIQFTSDIIVGFPGETYENFLDTVEIIKKVKYYQLFTFIYSPRKGTPAADMPDGISKTEKSRWFTELLRIQDSIADEIGQSLVGSTAKVLFDSDMGDGKISGRSNQYYNVEVEGDFSDIGTLQNVTITSFDGVLKGKILRNEDLQNGRN